jgi:hypothetical protein
MNIITYTHHGNVVKVREDLKGKHRENCLCWSGCKKLKIGQEDNCKIAKALYDNCVKFKVVTPVWECPEYDN